MDKTLEEIRCEGLEALRERLGRAGMIRFLQQSETGHGDYARERHAWVDRMTFDDLRAAIDQLHGGATKFGIIVRTGDPCPESGHWRVVGTGEAVPIRKGAIMPAHNEQPVQWELVDGEQ